ASSLQSPFKHCSFLPRIRCRQIKKENMKNIFVGNLSFGATEESLRSMFENYGAVERVSIVTDRETGRSRGFGFVEMTNAGEAERAIAALNGSDLGGRSINVNEARPKEDHGSSTYGGDAYRANSGSYRGNRDRDQGRTSRW